MPEPELDSKEQTSNLRSLREKTAFYLEHTDTIIGLWFNLSILGLILLSSAIFVAQTYSISQQLQASLKFIDLVILITFTIEYLLRFWVAQKRVKFLFSFFGIIDLVAILPLFIGWTDIRFIRVFRWFRIGVASCCCCARRQRPMSIAGAGVC